MAFAPSSNATFIKGLLRPISLYIHPVPEMCVVDSHTWWKRWISCQRAAALWGIQREFAPPRNRRRRQKELDNVFDLSFVKVTPGWLPLQESWVSVIYNIPLFSADEFLFFLWKFPCLLRTLRRESEWRGLIILNGAWQNLTKSIKQSNFHRQSHQGS